MTTASHRVPMALAICPYMTTASHSVPTPLTTCLYMTTLSHRVSPVLTTCLYTTSSSHRVLTVLTICLYMTSLSHKVPMYSPVGCTPPNQAKHKEAAQWKKKCCIGMAIATKTTGFLLLSRCPFLYLPLFSAFSASLPFSRPIPSLYWTAGQPGHLTFPPTPPTDHSQPLRATGRAGLCWINNG